MFRIKLSIGCCRTTQQGRITCFVGWEVDGRPMGLPKGNDAQAAILSREEHSKQKKQTFVRKSRGHRAMCRWETWRCTMIYLGFHIECEPRDRERGHADGGGVGEQHRSGRTLCTM